MNKSISFVIDACVISLAVLFIAVPITVRGQQPRRLDKKPKTSDAKLSPDQQQALGLVTQLVDDLKRESDKPAAALVQSQIADLLWNFDEGGARAIFNLAFEAARQAPGAELSEADKMDYLRRQTSSLQEIMRRAGSHDKQIADNWVQQLEEESADKDPSSQPPSVSRTVLMGQIALDVAERNPEQGLQLGLLSLSGAEVPETFGRLLFALSSKNRTLSDALFAGAISTIQRNGYNYTPALISLTNYTFDSRGRPFAIASKNVPVLINLFANAAETQAARWQTLRASGAPNLPESSTAIFRFLASRALPIVELSAPDKLSLLRMKLDTMLAGMSPLQRQQTDILLAQQLSDSTNKGDLSVETRIERAEKEKNAEVRDQLLRRIALDLGFNQSTEELALTVVNKIQDIDLRAQTEDDINLVLLARRLSSGNHDAAYQITIKLNDRSLRAKMLAEQAKVILNGSKNNSRALALLSESSSAALKGENTPDKLIALLDVAEQIAKIDPTRAFETLFEVIKTSNSLKPDSGQVKGVAAAFPFKSVSYIMVNGKELSAGERATAKSITFAQVGTLARIDFSLTRSIGEGIQNKIFRARFLLAAASGVLVESKTIGRSY